MSSTENKDDDDDDHDAADAANIGSSSSSSSSTGAITTTATTTAASTTTSAEGVVVVAACSSCQSASANAVAKRPREEPQRRLAAGGLLGHASAAPAPAPAATEKTTRSVVGEAAAATAVAAVAECSHNSSLSSSEEDDDDDDDEEGAQHCAKLLRRSNSCHADNDDDINDDDTFDTLVDVTESAADAAVAAATCQKRELPYAATIQEYFQPGGTVLYRPRPEWLYEECDSSSSSDPLQTATTTTATQHHHASVDEREQQNSQITEWMLAASAEVLNNNNHTGTGSHHRQLGNNNHDHGDDTERNAADHSSSNNSIDGTVIAALWQEEQQLHALLSDHDHPQPPPPPPSRRKPTVFGKDWDSVLHVAIRENATEAALALIDMAAAATKATAADTPGTAAATTTKSGRDHHQQQHKQHRHSLIIEATNVKGVTPIILAAQKGNITVVRRLLHRGANPAVASMNGTTAVLQAAHFGHVEILEMLLRAAAIADRSLPSTATTSSFSSLVEAANSNHTTPLMRASQEGHAAAVRLLLLAGAAVNRRNRVQMTALMLASQRGHAAVCEQLVAAGAELDAKTNQDSTSLLLACKRGNVDVVRVLVTAGAELFVTDSRGRTAKQVAQRRGNTTSTAAANVANRHGDANNESSAARNRNSSNKLLIDLLDPSAQIDLMQRAARRKRSFEMIRLWNLLQHERANVPVTNSLAVPFYMVPQLCNAKPHHTAVRWSLLHGCNNNDYRLLETSTQALLRTMTLPASLVESIAQFLPLPKLWNKRLSMMQSTCFVNSDATVANALDFIDEVLEEGGFLEACDAAQVPRPFPHHSWQALKRSSRCLDVGSEPEETATRQRQQQERPNVTEDVVPSPRDWAKSTCLELRRQLGYLSLLARHAALGRVLAEPPYYMPASIVQQLARVSDVASLSRRMRSGVHFEATVAMDIIMLASRLSSWHSRERGGFGGAHHHQLPRSW